jgi:cell division transport system permease protein
VKFIKLYFSHHFGAVKMSVAQLWQKPLSNVMTCMVIGIALALPIVLWVFLGNVKNISNHWHQSGQISLFLQQSLDDKESQAFFSRIQQHVGVGQTLYISSEQGLNELQEESGFNQAIEQLPVNPLPAVIEVTPELSFSSPAKINLLFNELKRYPEVDTAKLDLDWVKRLHAMVTLAQQFVDGLMILLAFAVIFIIGNTIRLAIQNQREEIEVLKLVGATNPFIRRPFLYVGVYLGFIGALFAMSIVVVLLLSLSHPVQNLSYLYQVNYTLSGLTIYQCLFVTFLGAFLGWLGARLSVNRQIAKIEPSQG